MRRQKKQGRILLLRNWRVLIMQNGRHCLKQIKDHGQNQDKARLTKRAQVNTAGRLAKSHNI